MGVEEPGKTVTALQGTRRAVFLDRDGVINRAIACGGNPYPLPRPKTWRSSPA